MLFLFLSHEFLYSRLKMDTGAWNDFSVSANARVCCVCAQKCRQWNVTWTHLHAGMRESTRDCVESCVLLLIAWHPWAVCTDAHAAGQRHACVTDCRGVRMSPFLTDQVVKWDRFMASTMTSAFGRCLLFSYHPYVYRPGELVNKG